MRISDRDDVNHSEAAVIAGITAVAMMRGGELTSRQQRRIDRILAGAKAREDKKRAEARSAR